jgi:TRAP-type C4-dicarboxylate transport system permease small subunit
LSAGESLAGRAARGWRRTADTLALASSYGYALVFLLTLYEVFSRYVLRSPTSWTVEVCILLAAIHYLVGGVSALARDKHIRVDALTSQLPASWRRRLEQLEWLLVAAVCGVLGWWACRQAWVAIEGFERSGTQLNWPLPVVLKTLVAAVLLAMVVSALANLADRPRRGGGDVA